MVTARITSLNLAQETGWTTRQPLVLGKMRKDFRSSVYLFQEATIDMAASLGMGIGWSASKGQPCWRTDENRNTIMWDPKKWRDLNTISVSLSEYAGDLGDRHYRSVNWVQLQHLESKDVVWFGSAHLSNGADAGAERLAQARVLVKHLPAGKLALGVDRNSLKNSPPALALVAAGLVDFTKDADKRRTFPSGDSRTDGVQIDAIHAKGLILSKIVLHDTGRATDHRAWSVTVS